MRFMKIKLLIVSLLILVLQASVMGQQTAVYQNPQAVYKSGMELFAKSLFGPARDKFEQCIQQITDANNEIRVSAEYYQAICAVELFNDDAELLLRSFIENHPQSAHLRVVYFQLGKYKYRKKSYRSAIKAFEKADPGELTSYEKAEYYFMLGYSQFVRKQYEDAAKSFYQIIERDNNYKSFANYYYAHINYLNGNYETALKGFLTLKDDKYLGPVIPYYITHIYYKQKRYKDLLVVAEPLFDKSTPERKAEMARLIGEAYYNTERYKEAIPYLEQFYGQSSPTPQGQYQLGYAYYKTGNYDKAIEQLKHVGLGSDSLSQNANYHLGLCYLKTKRKDYALNAFKYASASKANPIITEDALYNYAKLSYELDFNPYNNAIRAFERYLNEYPKSLHRQEVMENLTKMYLSTKNYKQAKESIERIKNRNSIMNSAYHRIVYAIAVQDFNNANYEDAIVNFTDASNMRYTKSLIAPAKYWRAEAYFRQEKLNEAIEGYKDFLTSPGAINQDFYNRAYYNLAYAYMAKKDWANADINFRIFIRNQSEKDKNLTNDAYLRLADCYFIRSQFLPAIENYEKAIQLQGSETDYALFKKAEAYGALAKPNEKAQAFEELLSKYPRSTYAGNAELALANTYFNAGNNAKAVTHLTHIIENYPIQQNYVKKAMLTLGLVYVNMDKNDEAIAIWKRVNETYKGTPESKSALSAMREVYVKENKVNEFFAYVQSIGEKQSITEQDSLTYLAAENIYMQGDCDRSAPGFMDYLNRFPAGAFSVNAHFYLADCEFRSSMFDKALENYTFVTQLPVSAFSESSWERIAYIYYHKKDDFTKANEAYSELLKIAEYAKNIETAKVGLMRSLWNMGDTLRVIPAAQAVAAMDKITEELQTEALMIMAKSHLSLKQDSLGLAYLDTVIQVTSSDKSAEARYLKALHAFNAGNLNESESIIFDIIQQDPSYEYWVAKALVLSADIFVLMDNKHQAIATLESIIEGYDGDQDLIDEAKAKLKAIKEKKAEKVESLQHDKELIIDLNEGIEDESLFDLDPEEEEVEEDF
jgi:TolA-binding protein